MNLSMTNLYTFFCNLLPVQRKKVVLYAATERYGDNMRYVAEELLRRGECKVVWVSEKKKVCTPKGIRSVCGRYAMRRELSTARVIISDGRLIKYWAKGFLKKPGQVYIHARYGSFELAKEEVDRHDIVLKDIRLKAQDSRHLDILVSNCTWHTDNYRGSYLSTAEYLQIGTPRNDALLKRDRSEAIRSVKGRYGISETTQIALYAPAYRPWKKARFPKPNYGKILDGLKERFGGEWLLLIRRDPRLNPKKMRWLLPKGLSNVMDAWDYPDTAELLAASDVMIGDYSSCTFDFLLTGRPTFLYAPDADQYEKHIGFYEPLESAPMPLAVDNASLLSNIASFDAPSFSDKVKSWLEQCGNVEDGHASAHLCDYVMDRLGESLPELSFFRRQILRNVLYHVEKVNAKCRKIYILGINICNYSKTPNPYVDLPVQKNKILFRTNNRMSYNCNVKYIAEEIIRRKLPYELVWLVSPYILSYIKEIPPKIRLVMLKTQDSLYEYATSRIWIENNLDNLYVRKGFHKKEDQIWIMTWHGSVGLKKTIKNTEALKNLEMYHKNAKFIDYMISGATYETRQRRKEFPGKGKVLQIGHPRNDILITGDYMAIRRKICEKFNIPFHKKILLYAPTWRTGKYSDCYLAEFNDILTALAKRFDGEWLVMLRSHYYTLGLKEEKFVKSGEYVDVSLYPDMQELLVAADAMISDYSSSVLDYIWLGRPTFLYIPDRKRYEKEEGFLYPLEKTPFPLAGDINSLIQCIKNFDDSIFRKQSEEFCKGKGYVEDGHASERLVDFIEKLISVD